MSLAFVLQTPPPLDPAWLEHEEQVKLQPQRVFNSTLERQPAYAQECRDLNAGMMAPGSRYSHLAHGLLSQELAIPSSKDRAWIPMVHYLHQQEDGNADSGRPEVVVIYYHGGGLYVGEADSEDLSCRQLMHSGVSSISLYSVGYRLMPNHPASTCVSDALDAFNWILARTSSPTKIVVVGSSSGGQLATLVSQAAPAGSVHGVLLRCPVTADRASGPEYVPEYLRAYHTSASEPFVTSLLGIFHHPVPRDGLERMPLEAGIEKFASLPRTWVQICTNDTLYSDGLCYAMALEAAAVEVKVDVVEGWPHTFWLKAPHLDRAVQADEAMVSGLRWLLDAME